MEKQAQVLTHGHQLVRSFTQESLPLKLCLITSSQPDITTTKALL